MRKSTISKKSPTGTGSSPLNPVDPPGRGSSRLKLVRKAKESGAWILPEVMNGTEEFLCEVVDACASSVAVLDESGSILYASKSWHLFERSHEMSADMKAQAPDVFAHCLRIDDEAISNNARVTTLVTAFRPWPRQTERISRHYCIGFCQSDYGAGSAAEPAGFRFSILMTFEMISREALRRTEERFRVLLEKTHILPQADFTARFTRGTRPYRCWAIRFKIGISRLGRHTALRRPERAVRKRIDLPDSDNYGLNTG